MDPGQEVDQNKKVESERSIDPIVNSLGDLRSDGDILFSHLATSIPDAFYVELEGKLKQFQLLVQSELNDGNSSKNKTILQTLGEGIGREILPRASTWSQYAQLKADHPTIVFSPSVMQELYTMSYELSNLLRSLPESVPEKA